MIYVPGRYAAIKLVLRRTLVRSIHYSAVFYYTAF